MLAPKPAAAPYFPPPARKVSQVLRNDRPGSAFSATDPKPLSATHAQPFIFLTGLTLLLGLNAPAAVQCANNDGSHRRDEQMHLLRNGQPQPMTRDSCQLTGALATKNGFVVAASSSTRMASWWSMSAG